MKFKLDRRKNSYNLYNTTHNKRRYIYYIFNLSTIKNINYYEI